MATQADLCAEYIAAYDYVRDCGIVTRHKRAAESFASYRVAMLAGGETLTPVSQSYAKWLEAEADLYLR